MGKCFDLEYLVGEKKPNFPPASLCCIFEGLKILEWTEVSAPTCARAKGLSLASLGSSHVTNCRFPTVCDQIR